MGRRPRGGLDGDHTRPGGSALIGRENGRTFVRCYGPAASRPRCRWGIGAPGVSAKSASPSVVIEHGPSLKSPLGAWSRTAAVRFDDFEALAEAHTANNNTSPVPN